MKVLMFGWEFPPNISGGLGTACYGLTKGLSSFNDVDLTFVVPNVYGNEEKVDIKLIGAGDIVLSGKKLLKQRELEMKGRLDPDQQVSAYITPEHYKKLLASQKIRIKGKIKNTTSGKFEFAGKYGSGLYNEISRYAIKVDFWDIDAMADAIYGILNYPSLGKYMAKNGLKEVNNLRWINSAARVKEIYFNLASCKAG